jgi:pimeloyl-ACP methyl ester carboxylesterase
LLIGSIVHDPAIVSPELVDDMVSAACRSFGTAAVVNAALRTSRRQDVRLIGCPTLVVGGERDRLVSPRSLDDVATSITGARLEVMPDVGHHPMFERPDDFNVLLRGFFDDLRAADRPANR